MLELPKELHGVLESVIEQIREHAPAQDEPLRDTREADLARDFCSELLARVELEFGLDDTGGCPLCCS